MPGLALRVNNLSKCFRIYRTPKDVALEYVLGKKRHEECWALKDITVDIQRGEVIGLIGRNGSGKSTMLRILTGVLDSTAGSVEVNGKVSAILELGSGFHPDYTGRENVVRGGMVLGMSRREIQGKLESIIEFSGIRDSIDRPFKTYSSGMQSRLTFATATAIDPDIFIVDEALATGDSPFVQKSLKRIRSICQGGCTSILVSHSTSILASICTRVIWLERGAIRRMGEPAEVIREYELALHQELSQGATAASNAPVPTERILPNQRPALGESRSCRFAGVELIDGDGRRSAAFRNSGSLTIRIPCVGFGPQADQAVSVVCRIQRAIDGTIVNEFEAPVNPWSAAGFIEARISPLQLNVGDYFLSLGMKSLDSREYDPLVHAFKVMASGWAYNGAYYPLVDWVHEADPMTSLTDGPERVCA